ncbi:serine protease [Ignisphaera sp. 4213-co]|uniref:Serine protease n=1 Tax=Ignisphaera cupida TaxID=3050454 RepID=A0ABD4Z7R8_9CREN|nr:serine protease [Ignisphaera sp. 4213-co]MDK6029052.1 serine protease [Ignisphaera sp. 4213-co]
MNNILKVVEDYVKKLIDVVANSVVIVSSNKDVCSDSNVDDFGEAMATGFYVDRNIVVSVYHVLKKNVGNGEDVCILTFDGDFSRASILADDSENDIVFLATNRSGKPLALKNNLIDIGSIVFSVGFAYGLLRYFITYGIVSGLDVKTVVENMEIEGLMLLNMPIALGMSGAPVVDINGNVVGMINSRSILFNELSLAIPSTKIVRDLIMLKRIGKIVNAKLGLKLLQSPKTLKKAGLENGLIVIDIQNREISNVCKIDVGDVLIEINGVKINSLEDLRNIITNSIINNLVIHLLFKSVKNNAIKHCSIEPTSFIKQNNIL